jgi:hypothetical protein
MESTKFEYRCIYRYLTEIFINRLLWKYVASYISLEERFHNVLNVDPTAWKILIWKAQLMENGSHSFNLCMLPFPFTLLCNMLAFLPRPSNYIEANRTTSCSQLFLPTSTVWDATRQKEHACCNATTYSHGQNTAEKIRRWKRDGKSNGQNKLCFHSKLKKSSRIYFR